MIVLINPSQNTVTICDNKVKVFDISDISGIQHEIANKDVIYVTEYVETSGNEIINLIEESYESNSLGDQTEIDDGILYLRTTGKSKCYVNFAGKDYMFAGMYDFKAISDLPENFAQNCKMVRDGLKSGLFEIVNEYKKRELDEKRDSDNSVRIAKKNAFDVSRGSVDDPIEIDLGNKISFKRN